MPKEIAIVSQHDMRLSTVCTREVLDDDHRLEARARLEMGRFGSV